MYSFEGKIVVSGGFGKMKLRNSLKYKIDKLKSVEVYDHHENKWLYFPCMLTPRINHSAVSISNKMIIIGGSSCNCEVFDSVTRKFTYIKSVPKNIKPNSLNQTVCIGYKIYFFST